MKTIEIQVYTFDELSEEAKEVARNWRRSGGIDSQFYADEIIESAKKFADIFGLRFGRRYSDLQWGYLEDSFLRQLSGVRLATYLWNNHKKDLFKGKYYSLWSKTEVSYKHYKEGYPVLKQRRSKILLDNSCVLTGVCYDDDILKPFYDFMKRPDKYTTFEYLLEEVENAIEKCFNDVEDWVNSDEYIDETIRANEYEFTQDGKRF